MLIQQKEAKVGIDLIDTTVYVLITIISNAPDDDWSWISNYQLHEYLDANIVSYSLVSSDVMILYIIYKHETSQTSYRKLSWVQLVVRGLMYSEIIIFSFETPKRVENE